MPDFLMPLVLEDLTDEQARARARGHEGPSIAWAVGHLVQYRIFVMGLLGEERDNPWAEKFGSAAATDGSDYPTVADFRAEWDSVGEAFRNTLAAATEEQLDYVSEGGAHDERSLRDQAVFFAWHEGYHMGVMGAMRKSLGLLGPAEKVMAAREAAAAEATGGEGAGEE